MAERAEQISAFLRACGWDKAARRPLAGDASFRRYERLARDGETAVLMDAPPPMEDVAAFHGIQEELLALGLSPPRCLGIDEAAGFMLLEDLGDRTFTRALQDRAEEEPLYRLATDLLVELHRTWQGTAGAIPPYDAEALETEALLLADWYYEAVAGRPIESGLRQAYLAAWRPLWPIAWDVPETLVLRDYHVDNLMVLEGRTASAACGLLDFQDARIGPVTYDLVSLLEDARRAVPQALAEAMLARYLGAFPDLDRARFAASYAVLGAQRNAKIIGIFTRLSRRDGKDGYLDLIPHVWRLLEHDMRHPALTGVRQWFDDALPAARRRAPAPAGHQEARA